VCCKELRAALRFLPKSSGESHVQYAEFIDRATGVLAMTRPKDPDVLSVLSEVLGVGLKLSDMGLCLSALRALGVAAKKEPKALGQLESLLQHPRLAASAEIAISIAIQNNRRLAMALSHPETTPIADLVTSVVYIEGLSQPSGHYAEFLPRLLELPETRSYVEKIIPRLGSRASLGIPELKRVLTFGRAQARLSSARVLGELVSAGVKEAHTALKAVPRDRREDVRSAVDGALSRAARLRGR
jgi:hypothetical protein